MPDAIYPSQFLDPLRELIRPLDNAYHTLSSFSFGLGRVNGILALIVSHLSVLDLLPLMLPCGAWKI